MKALGLLAGDGCGRWVPGPDVAEWSGQCSEGGNCEPELHEDCQPPDYHCSKCGRYTGAA
jgi:hypothetical protein